ncbi:MAG: beta-ketoacyl-[acyl-carrier-protein] synthase family protein [Aquitalea sp.]|nr:beta-ketoacyl-[acyl-carrier-protein] synthase family protein [Aquitalea sp.]
MKMAVAITGIGLISPLGNQPDAVFAKLMAGESGIRRLEEAETGCKAVVVGAVEFDPAAWFTRLQLSGVDRVSQMAVAAATLALEDAALSLPEDKEQIGVYTGCAMGGSGALDKGFQNFYQSKTRVSPLSVIASMANAPAGHISMRFGITGPSVNYSVACASSAIALGEAMRAIRNGEISCAIAGGAEAMLYPGIINAWQSMQVLASPAGEQPEQACRPYDKERSGLVLAEGSAFLILERLEDALARGARIYATLDGYACRSDATHITKPDVGGQVRTMRAALADAGVAVDQVGYCNSHGTATQVGDVVECQALQTIWGEDTPGLQVSATKSMHGHLLGATGGLETAITALALHRQQVPPTANCQQVDENCRVQHVLGKGVEAPGLQAAISNSFAFGGSNACLVLRRHQA